MVEYDKCTKRNPEPFAVNIKQRIYVLMLPLIKSWINIFCTVVVYISNLPKKYKKPYRLDFTFAQYYLQCHSYVSNYWDIPKFWLHPKTQRKYNLRLEISNQRHDQKKGYEAHQMYNAQLKGISKKDILFLSSCNTSMIGRSLFFRNILHL